MSKTVIITDLDGSLLDAKTRDWSAHAKTLEDLRRRGIPVVFCSSKTRAETEAIRRETGNTDPFIVESGGAVVMPSGTVVLGRPYLEVLEAFRRLKRHVPARGFSDMTVADVARECGLSREQAQMAKQREYDEPFLCDADPSQFARELHMRCTWGGRFQHLHGDTDRGQAVRALLEWGGPARTIGIGDSANDLSMLAVVDVPCIVPKRNGSYDTTTTTRLTRVRRCKNWSDAVHQALAGRP